MATMKDFDYLREACNRAFFYVFERQKIGSGEIEYTASEYIHNALKLYLSLPTAESFPADWIPGQYELFGNRVCEIVRTDERDVALIWDFIEAIQRCGIIFVCAPPGGQRDGKRNG